MVRRKIINYISVYCKKEMLRNTAVEKRKGEIVPILK
jgi:hypothetical protein